MEEEITGVLDGWWREGPVFYGNIYGDTKHRFLDGTLIHTSGIESIDTGEPEEGSIVITLNSVYRLGEPA